MLCVAFGSFDRRSIIEGFYLYLLDSYPLIGQRSHQVFVFLHKVIDLLLQYLLEVKLRWARQCGALFVQLLEKLHFGFNLSADRVGLAL